MARLEGAYEQVDRRLDALHDDLRQLRETLERRFAQIDGRFSQVDQKFLWLAGLVVGTWMTTILTILFHHST